MHLFKQATWLAGGTLIVTLVLSLAGCNPQQQQAADVASEAPAVTQAAAPAPAAPAPTAPSHAQARQGRVVSAQVAGGYSYLEVDTGGERIWLATMISDARPGEQIAWQKSAVMQNFTSKALQRSFDRIHFVDRVMRPQAPAAISRGVVAERLTAAGYSFIRVDDNGDSLWLATPEMPLEVGQVVEWQGGSLMRNFTSRSLGRSFDEILFVSAVTAS